MAIDRIHTDEIITEILNIIGHTSSAVAPWASDANLIVKINIAAHRIPGKLRQIAVGQGMKGRLAMPMWWTTTDSTPSGGAGDLDTGPGVSTVSFPDDMDLLVSLYDLTNNRFIDVVEVPYSEKWYRDLREATPGITKVLHLQGTTTFASTTVRDGRLLPDVVAGITPSLRLGYYRLPADLASGSASFPDADTAYHYLWVLETVLDLLRPDTPNYDRYLALEKEMLVEMASHMQLV